MHFYAFTVEGEMVQACITMFQYLTVVMGLTLPQKSAVPSLRGDVKEPLKTTCSRPVTTFRETRMWILMDHGAVAALTVNARNANKG